MPKAIICPDEGVGACDTGLPDDHIGQCPRFTNSNWRSSLDTFIPLIMILGLARLQMQVELYACNLSLYIWIMEGHLSLGIIVNSLRTRSSLSKLCFEGMELCSGQARLVGREILEAASVQEINILGRTPKQLYTMAAMQATAKLP